MHYEKETYEELFDEFTKQGRIISSNNTFKIKLFLERADSSLLIAQHNKTINPKGQEPEKNHWNYWVITIAYYSMLYAAKAAILTRGFEVKDHLAAQIALGHLFIPDQMEKEDLELLDQAHKIFEDEYIKYFEDARIQSHVARYSSLKKYSQRQVDEIFSNAAKFIGKIKLVLA